MTAARPGEPPALPRLACTPAAIRTVRAAHADAHTARRYAADLDAASEQARTGGDLTPLLETIRRWWFEAGTWRDPAAAATAWPAWTATSAAALQGLSRHRIDAAGHRCWPGAAVAPRC